jgi:CcmD family protein
MLNTILQYAPAETTRFMIAGYVVIFSVMFLYILSLILRRRNLKRDLATLEEMEHNEK